MLPMLAVPGMLNADNAPFSLFLTACLVFATGFFAFWRDTMDWQLTHRVPETAFLVWLLLGFGAKIWDATVTGGAWWAQRSGGIWAASHGAGILILLFPFVASRWLVAGAVLYSLLSFSRGVYIAMFLTLLGYALRARRLAGRIGVLVDRAVWISSH